VNISIFGLGYVGVVSAACLAAEGHKVIGVDINQAKVDLINKGIPPIVERDLAEILEQANKKGLLYAVCDAGEAIDNSDVSIICVGTPSRQNQSLDTKNLENVCRQIGGCLRHKEKSHTLIFKSTMLPGTMRHTVIPIIEECSEKKHNTDFFAVFNPEFLRESSAIYDFYNPSKTVVGADSEEIADKVLAIYKNLPGVKIKTDIEAAEMVKYVDNSFHALKVTFANEIGLLCKSMGMDSHRVMDIFIQDTKLNISSAYLKPGFAFGGSCLPKDLRAINYLAKKANVETPLLNSIMQSNHVQILNVIKKIISFKKKKIGIAGLSFKAGTDDLRESPMVEMMETLLEKGYDIKIYDKSVSISGLFGVNREYINNRIPQISYLMVDTLDELLKDREVIVIGNCDEEFRKLFTNCRDDQIIYDLVRLGDDMNERENYEGMCW
jgi:GDP-mannose 6-dehydrogenase